MDRLELLRRITIFEGLKEDDLQALASHLVERRFGSGEMIFHLGDPGTEMYLIEEGHVNIHLPGEDSRRVSLKDLAAGEYFGEIALFDDKPRSASALSTAESRLLALSRPTLWGYLEARPQAALPILRVLSERLRETNTLLSLRASRNAVRDVERNLGFAERFADRVAEANGSWAFILALMALTGVWMLVNTRALLSHPFDEYPYVFYNLVLAVLVALQGPLIVMSQNRQALKDRAQSDADYLVNLKNEVNIETILRELGEFRAEFAASLDPEASRRAPPESFP
jgi:CRP/FNR family cyclic AMP-dependent transcriptional regulator